MKPLITLIILLFLSGASDGFTEVLLHHYPSFEKMFPKTNPQYWNPKISWENKYNKSYPFAKTLLVPLTDSYHLNRFLYKALLFLSLCLVKVKGRWLVVYWASYAIGFWVVWEVIF